MRYKLERQTTGSTMRVKKSCLLDATILLDDGTPVQTVNQCEIRLENILQKIWKKFLATRKALNTL